METNHNPFFNFSNASTPTNEFGEILGEGHQRALLQTNLDDLLQIGELENHIETVEKVTEIDDHTFEIESPVDSLENSTNETQSLNSADTVKYGNGNLEKKKPKANFIIEPPSSQIKSGPNSQITTRLKQPTAVTRRAPNNTRPTSLVKTTVTESNKKLLQKPANPKSVKSVTASKSIKTTNGGVENGVGKPQPTVGLPQKVQSDSLPRMRKRAPSASSSISNRRPLSVSGDAKTYSTPTNSLSRSISRLGSATSIARKSTDTPRYFLKELSDRNPLSFSLNETNTSDKTTCRATTVHYPRGFRQLRAVSNCTTARQNQHYSIHPEWISEAVVTPRGEDKASEQSVDFMSWRDKQSNHQNPIWPRRSRSVPPKPHRNPITWEEI